MAKGDPQTPRPMGGPGGKGRGDGAAPPHHPPSPPSTSWTPAAPYTTSVAPPPCRSHPPAPSKSPSKVSQQDSASPPSIRPLPVSPQPSSLPHATSISTPLPITPPSQGGGGDPPTTSWEWLGGRGRQVPALSYPASRSGSFDPGRGGTEDETRGASRWQGPERARPPCRRSHPTHCTRCRGPCPVHPGAAPPTWAPARRLERWKEWLVPTLLPGRRALGAPDLGRWCTWIDFRGARHRAVCPEYWSAAFRACVSALCSGPSTLAPSLHHSTLLPAGSEDPASSSQAAAFRLRSTLATSTTCHHHHLPSPHTLVYPPDDFAGLGSSPASARLFGSLSSRDIVSHRWSTCATRTLPHPQAHCPWPLLLLFPLPECPSFSWPTPSRPRSGRAPCPGLRVSVWQNVAPCRTV